MVTSQEALLERLSGGLQMLNPQRVLERGFSIVSGADGRVVRDAATLAAGARLDLTLARGGASVVVEETHSRAGAYTQGAKSGAGKSKLK